MQFFILNLVARVYGEDAYGDCVYNEGCVAGSNTAGGGTGLSNTGFWIVLVISLACLLIFVALLARWIASRNNKKLAVSTKNKRVARGK